MARFKASLDALAHILDLPEDVKITNARPVIVHNQVVLEFETDGGELPDGEIMLEYTTDPETGRVWLSGYSEV